MDSISVESIPEYRPKYTYTRLVIQPGPANNFELQAFFRLAINSRDSF
ncbi:MAG: hypothetical protein WD491_07420 [Balneolales bacterium]